MEKLSFSINNNNSNYIGLPPSGSSVASTKSDQLAEKVAAAFKSPPNSTAAAAPYDAVSSSAGDEGGDAALSRKSSRRLMSAASLGRSGGGGGGGGKNTQIRKSRSAQMKFELDEVSSGAALSRASSASLGLSFSFTGFTVPPDEIADSKPFSDDDIPEDLEAGMRKPKVQTEPTVPIYLKARKEIHDLGINYGNNRTWLAI